MFCPHCGNQLPDTAKFCGQCGAQMNARPQAEPQPQAQPQPQTYQQPQAQPAVQPYQAAQPQPQAYQLPQAQPQAQPYQQPISQGPARDQGCLDEDRNIIVVLILSYLTCGIYGCWYLHTLARDANIVCNDSEKTPGLAVLIAFNFITLGFYEMFWYYKLANRLQVNAPKYGLTISENGSSILLWWLIGLLICGVGPLVAKYLTMGNMNKICHAYNVQHGYSA